MAAWLRLLVEMLISGVQISVLANRNADLPVASAVWVAVTARPQNFTSKFCLQFLLVSLSKASF